MLSSFGSATWFDTPRAQTSGFVRPSAVGPGELKLAISPVSSTAPAVMMLSPSAGAAIVPQSFWR